MTIGAAMPKCGTCGKEFTVLAGASLATSLSRDLVRATRFRLGRLVGTENGWLILGIVVDLFVFAIALDLEGFWARAVSFAVFFAIMFVLATTLLRKAHYSRIRSHNCPECSNAIIAKRLLRPEEYMPHKVTRKKEK
jgi:DNA-directed RNA polymerase subunit RPC12/RpoP